MQQATEEWNEQGLEQTVSSIFNTMLGLDVTRIPGCSPEAGMLTASISLAGSWNGQVVIGTGPREACRLTAHFLSIAPPPSVNDDVRDVMGELANMIGGNLKCALAPGARMSLPKVDDAGSFQDLQAAHSHLHTFATQEGRFWVAQIPFTSC